MAATRWLNMSLGIAGLCTLSACAQLLPPDVAAPVPAALPPSPIPAPQPPAPPPKLVLSDLARYAPTEIVTVLGAPSLKRNEGLMQILQFTSGTCITDLVFNENAQLVHVEARAKTGIPIEIQPCLDSFEQDPRAIKGPVLAQPTS